MAKQSTIMSHAALLLSILSLLSVNQAAADNWYSNSKARTKGGSQGYAEEIKKNHREFGAPAHPTKEERSNIRLGESGTAKISISPEKPLEQFEHFFETSVGSGHMSLTARADYRSHLTMAARDLGVKHIRGHGLLDDDMSVSYAEGLNAFYNIDSLVDFLISIGMRPIFELSFMPTWLANGTETVCHYKGNAEPPTNFTKWGELIGALGQHMVDKYGEVSEEFFFEVWNEPNDGFWKGTQAQYFELYTQAAWGLKNASTKLQVGGPATCCADCWIGDFINYCRNESIPFDFVSTHAYSSCQMKHLGDADYLRHSIENARSILDAASANVPWLVTEFGASCNQGFGDPNGVFFPSAYHDMIDQSSYTIKTMAQVAGAGQPQAMSYWAISDVFEESFFPVHNESFHGMFGLVNLHGIPKPSYRAYQLLHETGTMRVNVSAPVFSPSGSCGVAMNHTDVFGGDLHTVNNVSDAAACCDLCKQYQGCDVATYWMSKDCGLKSWEAKTNVTTNPERTTIKVTKPALTNDQLCGQNTGILAVVNQTDGAKDVYDLLVFNHAAFADEIVDCSIEVTFTSLFSNLDLDTATIRRVDETHSNPLAAWIAMGAPDYTTAAQNQQLLEASQLVVEPLRNNVNVTANGFVVAVPTHGVAAIRVQAK